MVEGKHVISQLAEKFSLPPWWVEIVLIEYLDCRHFCRGDELWSIDFNLIENRDLENILKSSKVVIAATSLLYHNIGPDELTQLIIRSNTGEGIGEKRTDILVDGLANTDCFLLKFNPLDEWDPKLSFNEYCIILDEGRFYQWKIAYLDKSEWNNNEYSWNSKILDLNDLNRINEEIGQLRNDYSQKEDVTLRSLCSKSETLYKELEETRSRIRQDLLKYHNDQALETKNDGMSDQIFHKLKTEGEPLNIPHYSRPLIVSVESAFQYFSDIESYPDYYPNICKKIDE